MAKPKIPKQKHKYSELNKRLAKYVMLVQSIYDTLNLEAAKLVERLGVSESDVLEKTFNFSDYPETRNKVKDIQRQFANEIQAIIYRGTSEEWKISNEVQDLLANSVLKSYNAVIDKEKYNILYQTNSDALKAFQNRKDKGLNISTKLWKQSIVYKKELEDAISCALEKGYSAVSLSKRISKYLLDFPSLQKDYKEKFGTASKAIDCEYRSIRLAASEINMAYRTAENERWKQMNFVVGYEIKVSGNHNCKGVPQGQFRDICDTLSGKYPKDFKWTGWHPLCRCYKIPILKTEDEFFEWDGKSTTSSKSVNQVNDVPDSFKAWIEDNKHRIDESAKRNTLPYFLKDNEHYYIKPIQSVKSPITSDKPKDKDFKFNKSILNDLKKRGFTFGGIETISGFNQSAISGFNLPKVDDALSNLFNEYGIDITKREITVTARGNAELIYEGMKDGDRFELKRFFVGSHKYKEVQHSLFTVPISLQGKGISKKVLSCFYDEYKKSGIAKINVHANIDVGGYTWGRYGFATEKRDLDDLFLEVKNDSFRDQKSVKLAEKKVLDFYSKNDKSTLFPMNLIADKPYGKDVLLGSSWYGVINMNDKAQLGIFENYLFR